MTLLLVFRKSYITSAAVRKVLIYATALSGAAVFYVNGLYDWRLVLTITIAASIGNYFGVNYGIKRGEKFVRAIFLVLTFALGFKLLFFS